jgi:hypothetical protein
MENCLTYGLIFTMLERLTNMDKFDYYMEFMSMRLDDPQFRLMYGINDFDKWYADYMEILNQKHGEPANETD